MEKVNNENNKKRMNKRITFFSVIIVSISLLSVLIFAMFVNSTTEMTTPVIAYKLDVDTNITAGNKICDSVGCIGDSVGSSYNQDLNTTSNVVFNNVDVDKNVTADFVGTNSLDSINNITTNAVYLQNITFDSGFCIYHNGTGLIIKGC